MRTLLLGCVVAVLATGAQAQGTRGQAGSTGVVRGVVFDSLLAQPLEGARVMVRGTELGATTDGRGRYQIAAVPLGRRVLIVEHPVLDSIGVSNLAAAVTVTADRAHIVDLAVPSLITMRRAACATRPTPMSRDTGVIYGSVQDIDTGARLAGARVLVSWLVARRGTAGIELDRPSMDLRTDSVGNYYGCGVPTEHVITVVAQAGPHRSGVTERLLGTRGVGRHDLSVSRTGTSSVDSLSGLRRGRATLAGIVRDREGNPRPSARVLVDDALGEAYADSGGRFVLPFLPSGSQMAMARMIGYGSMRQQVELKDGDTTWVEFSMRTLTTLDTIRVNASPWAAGRLDEIEQRARSGLGHRLGETELQGIGLMRSAFTMLPALTVQGPSAYDYQLWGNASGGFCELNVYIDGRRGTVAELSQYRPDQLITIEYFPRAALVPMQYANPGSTCGAVLVWTKYIR